MTSWPDANRKFHFSLDSACDHRQLLAVMSRLADLSRGYVALSVASSASRSQQAHEEHLALLDLYKRRAVDGAIQMSLRHIAETQRLVREVFERSSQAAAGDRTVPDPQMAADDPPVTTRRRPTRRSSNQQSEKE